MQQEFTQLDRELSAQSRRASRSHSKISASKAQANDVEKGGVNSSDESLEDSWNLEAALRGNK